MATSDVTQDPLKTTQQKEDTKPEAKSQKIILIVEDDPILLKMYTEKFTFEGFSVLNAKDGEEALKTATEEKADVILLDIMLPRMSGTDFLEKFRETAKGKETPVIALTNLAEEEERLRAIKLGVKEYLVKAMQTPEQVVEKVKKHVG
jgi:Response regulators consisting of a CheY-like receiver domain and a winged-helix DNA-binding domain